MQLYYTSVACLLLLISAVSSYHGEYRIRHHKAGSGKHYVIAPESYDDFSNFAVAEYDHPYGYPPNLNVLLRIYNDYENGKPKECFLLSTARWDSKKVGISSLNRLGGNKLLVALYDELEDHDIQTRIVVIDVDNQCHRISQLDYTTLHGRVIVVPSSHNKFDVFVDSEDTCAGLGHRCRISYDLNFNHWGIRRSFNNNFDWSTVKIERSSKDELVVRGFVGNTYQVIPVHDKHDGTGSVIMKLLHESRDLQFFSSGTAFCWMSISLGDHTVNCTMYNKDYEVNFTKIVKFDDPRELIDVRKILDDELLLITKKKYCADSKDCWTMYSTIVRDDEKKREDVSLPFRCTGDQKELTVFGAEYDYRFEKVDFYYACRNGDMYNFNMYHIYEKLVE